MVAAQQRLDVDRSQSQRSTFTFKGAIPEIRRVPHVVSHSNVRQDMRDGTSAMEWEDTQQYGTLY
jgi:hypothetical protein